MYLIIVNMRTLLVSFFAFFLLSLNAQDKHDFTWILGYPPNNATLYVGGNRIDFSQGNPVVEFFSLYYDMDNPIIMSDENGILQWYTSGCDIINTQHQIMENGENLSPGNIHQQYCDQAGWGYLSYQGILGLPWPDKPGQYILLHNRFFSLSHLDTLDILTTIIDMNANNGLGKVVSKNQFLYTGKLNHSFTAVRHANGRDWWIMTMDWYSNTYYCFLFDPLGLHGPFAQLADDEVWDGVEQGGAYMCSFSPDGSKFVRLVAGKPAEFMIYDFDRCSGTLSNSTTISLPDTIMYAGWASFSPNSRYLYVSNEGERLYQFDTQADDIENSRLLVGEYDGYLSVYNVPTAPYAMVLGPDQRIYMTSGNAANLLHRIEYPDSAGVACSLRQHDIILPAHILFHPPNNPNYRLYNLPGSPCDTLGIKPPLEAYWRSGHDTMQGPLELQFTDLSYYEPVYWLWDFGDGTIDSTRSPVHQFPGPGIYEVCLTVCNANGMCDTQCRDVEIITVGTQQPNGGEPRSVRIYPNPTAGDWKIVWQQDVSPGEWHTTVFDLSGKMVYTASQNDRQALMPPLEPGFYVVKIECEGRIYTVKLVSTSPR